MTSDNHWHLKKEVPLALVFVIAVQTAGIVWWAASTNERVASIEARLEEQHSLTERTARMEAQLEGIHQAIIRMERRLDNAYRDAQ